MIKSPRKVLNAIITICVVSLIIGCFAALISNGNKCVEHNYSLSELSEGTYGWYYRVSSQVPAQNYDVITLCCNGTVATFQGNVHITYTDNKEPYAIVKDYNLVNADEVYVYVPSGTIRFQENVGV